MKLKTLKDLKEDEKAQFGYADRQIGYENALDEVKEEAIKWVKECGVCFKQFHRVFCSRHEVFTEFHNITGEDLEEAKENDK